MPYHSIVLAKQVPDTTEITPRAMKQDGTLNRSALPAVFNKDDLHALEMALAIKEKSDGTTAQVGRQVAEKMSIPQITYVEEIHTLEDGILEAKRLSDDGYEQV